MSRFMTSTSRFAAATARFIRARDGGIAILFGLSLIPIIGLVGLAVDYGVAITNRTRLDRAADAAALAAVVTAKAYVAAHSGESGVMDAALAAGQNRPSTPSTSMPGSCPRQRAAQTPQVTSSSNGLTVTANISYTATINNSFSKLFLVSTTTISNSATASVDLPSYLDFYLMVDVSGSMGLPATRSGMTQLASVNNDMYSDYKQGCQFACHFPGNKRLGPGGRQNPAPVGRR